jgi:hypothetical protein
MGKNDKELEQSLSVIKSVIRDPSWFREHPHYWAMASLPFAYASVCVEVVCKNSEKAGDIYQQLIAGEEITTKTGSLKRMNNLIILAMNCNLPLCYIVMLEESR